jgi:hypothetical protein
LLFLNLRVDLPPDEVAWAQGVVNANHGKPVILSTHRYLEDYRLPQYSGRFGSNSTNLQFGPFEQQYDPNAQTAEPVYADGSRNSDFTLSLSLSNYIGAPEPSSLTLLAASGLGLLAYHTWRRRKRGV